MKESVITTNKRFGLRHYFEVYLALWQNSIIREMTFKVNFGLWILVECLWFAMQLVFIGVIYQHTDSIGTWTQWEVVLLMGVSQFIQQLFSAIFLNNCVRLSELIRTGGLDFILLLPINTRFLISFRHVELGGFVNAGVAVGVILFSLHKLHYAPSLGDVGIFLVFCFLGMVIHYSLMFLLACVSFWTVKAQGIVWGYYNLFNIARMPDEVFRGFFKALFTFVFPVILVANVPARGLLNKITATWPMVYLGVGSVVLLVVSEWVWRHSLKRYTSASS